jgi:hypothetical protein
MSKARFAGRGSRPAQHLGGRARASALLAGAVQQQRLADLVADRVQRRQRGHRLLEDHAHAAAAQRADLAAVARQRQQVDHLARRARVGEQDLAAGDAAGARQDARG